MAIAANPIKNVGNKKFIERKNNIFTHNYSYFNKPFLFKWLIYLI